MNNHQTWKRGLLAGAVLASLAAWGVAAGPWSVPAEPEAGSAEPQAGPAAEGVVGVLHVQPFRLAESYPHLYRQEAPQVTAGYLVVLDVEAQRFVPRQTAENVLQFGPETVERINRGDLDGRLVGIVPANAGPDGWPATSLAGVAPFLAAPGLPEQWTAAEASRAWDDALASGAASLLPLPANATGLDLPTKDDLMRAAAGLIEEFAPSERALAESLAMPLLR